MAYINPRKDDVYLGDGVYIQEYSHGWGKWLYTYNGMTVTNEIFLEPEVLIKFVKNLEGMVK